jgi:hypothetical protein
MAARLMHDGQPTVRPDRMNAQEVDMWRLVLVVGVLVLVVGVLVLAVAAVPAMAQDPVKVDPKHYKLEFENDQVRVLRITYGPHEKSVMHEHPASVAVFLTDGQAKFTLPDGKTQDAPVKPALHNGTAVASTCPRTSATSPSS